MARHRMCSSFCYSNPRLFYLCKRYILPFLCHCRMDKKDFSKYIFDIYNQGALILSISIGHELGLFKIFFGTDEPLSVHDIAIKLDLKER